MVLGLPWAYHKTYNFGLSWPGDGQCDAHNSDVIFPPGAQSDDHAHGVGHAITWAESVAIDDRRAGAER
jgi:hypothetical protein